MISCTKLADMLEQAEKLVKDGDAAIEMMKEHKIVSLSTWKLARQCQCVGRKALEIVR